jgi:ubiquinone/menaquinone biosynthesis C-methylase UbiE
MRSLWEITPMTLSRVLEPEVMDSPQEATDYDAMDHREVNRRFVDDLLARAQGSGFRVQQGNSTPSLEPRTVNPEPFLDVLDLGTGTALIPIELCKRFADCRVMAVDAAVSMLDLARYNVEAASLVQRIELAHVDAKSLPFGDRMFDVVMSNSIVHHIPEPIHVLREAVRVTKPGGLLFIRDLVRPDSDEQLRRLVETYTAGANDHQRQMFADSLHAALSLDEIRALVAELGFEPETVQKTSDRHWSWTATVLSEHNQKS